MTYEASFALATICISALIVNYYIKLNKATTRTSTIFVGLVIVNMLTAASQFSKWIVDHYVVNGIVKILDMMSYVYFLTHILLVVLLFLYVLGNIKIWRELPRWEQCMILIPGAVEMLLILLNPLIHFIYEYTPEGVYQRNWGIRTTYLTFAYYLLLILIYVIMNSKHFTTRKRTVIFIVLFMGVFSVIIQFLFPEFKIETCMVAVCALIFFLFVQNPLEQMDSVKGVFTRKAFQERMHYNLIAHRNLEIVELVLSNYREYEANTNEEHGENIQKQVAAFLKYVNVGALVYCLEDGVFVIEVVQPEPGEVTRIINDIEERFRNPWHTAEGEINMSVRILRLKMPDQVNDESLLDAIMSRFVSNKAETRIMTIDDFDQSTLIRNRKITASVMRAMEKNNFEMRYTPIHSMILGRIVGMEANLRYYDSELGYVYDEEIFRYAQRSGHTLQIGEMIFENTCKYIAERGLKEQGISFVGIRLLPAMCLQYDILERLISVVHRYNIDPSMLYLQISEYSMSQASFAFRENMNKLVESGMRLCLEDYGSGFTSITSLYEMPFKVMKINRSVLRSALGNEKALITMDFTLMLARELSMMTMVDGVESQEYYDMISDMACDMAKGNYLFEQLDEEEFIRVLRISSGKAEKGEVL